MVTSIVYRKLPTVHHRQYVKRIIDGRLMIWHRDQAAALRMERKDAKDLADVLWMRSIGYGGTHGATETLGEYGTENV